VVDPLLAFLGAHPRWRTFGAFAGSWERRGKRREQRSASDPIRGPVYPLRAEMIKGAIVDASSFAAVRALWDAGKALQAGRILFEAMPEQERPVWAGDILRFCCNYSSTVPAEVAAVLDLTRCNSEWHRGHEVFDTLRRLTLRIERDQVAADTITRGIIGVAENVAKVVYNATSPGDPFDAESGWWIVSNVYWMHQHITDETFAERAWIAMSSRVGGAR
jgi:hypothetical protein